MGKTTTISQHQPVASAPRKIIKNEIRQIFTDLSEGFYGKCLLKSSNRSESGSWVARAFIEHYHPVFPISLVTDQWPNDKHYKCLYYLITYKMSPAEILEHIQNKSIIISNIILELLVLAKH